MDSSLNTECQWGLWILAAIKYELQSASFLICWGQMSLPSLAWTKRLMSAHILMMVKILFLDIHTSHSHGIRTNIELKAKLSIPVLSHDPSSCGQDPCGSLWAHKCPVVGSLWCTTSLRPWICPPALRSAGWTPRNDPWTYDQPLTGTLLKKQKKINIVDEKKIFFLVTIDSR